MDWHHHKSTNKGFGNDHAAQVKPVTWHAASSQNTPSGSAARAARCSQAVWCHQRPCWPCKDRRKHLECTPRPFKLRLGLESGSETGLWRNWLVHRGYISPGLPKQAWQCSDSAKSHRTIWHGKLRSLFQIADCVNLADHPFPCRASLSHASSKRPRFFCPIETTTIYKPITQSPLVLFIEWRPPKQGTIGDRSPNRLLVLFAEEILSTAKMQCRISGQVRSKAVLGSWTTKSTCSMQPWSGNSWHKCETYDKDCLGKHKLRILPPTKSPGT